MPPKKNRQVKTQLHRRNANRGRYDLEALVQDFPALEKHIKPSKYGGNTVDFSSPEAVKVLNQALLSHYYGIKRWEFPDTNLCPPIPGRADYIHYVADLLGVEAEEIPKGEKVTLFDVGIGASCIYPIIAVTEYGWKCIGSDVDPKSIKSAQHIVNVNPLLKGKIWCRLQKNDRTFFADLIGKDEKIDITVCNPPFHASAEDAEREAKRKVENLSGKKVKKAKLNFAGINNELIYEGGEITFITNMIRESKDFAQNCFWFSTLVSKQAHLQEIQEVLGDVEVADAQVIPIGTGNKFSRIVAWTFLSEEEQSEWREERWGEEEEETITPKSFWDTVDE